MGCLIGAGVYKGFSGVLAIPISEVVGQVFCFPLVQCTGLLFLDCRLELQLAYSGGLVIKGDQKGWL